MRQWTLFEEMHWAKGIKWIAGVDEVGRGPLAGPVVAAACMIPPGVIFSGIDDSKKLTEKQREALFDAIVSHPDVLFGLGIVEAPEIDRINILQATFKAMHQAVQGLTQSPEVILVDGNCTPVWPYISQAIVGGDALSQSIAAASVLAKVTRDRRMEEEDTKYPGYGFASHKGYGTKFHLRAIEALGPCPLHRLSFAPLKPTYANQ